MLLRRGSRQWAESEELEVLAGAGCADLAGDSDAHRGGLTRRHVQVKRRTGDRDAEALAAVEDVERHSRQVGWQDRVHSTSSRRSIRRSRG